MTDARVRPKPGRVNLWLRILDGEQMVTTG
jgi:hypothetical protein